MNPNHNHHVQLQSQPDLSHQSITIQSTASSNIFIFTSPLQSGTSFTITVNPGTNAPIDAHNHPNDDTINNDQVEDIPNNDDDLVLEDDIIEDTVDVPIADDMESGQFSNSSQLATPSSAYIQNAARNHAEQMIIEHFNTAVTDGKCSCSKKRDSRSKPFTLDNITPFKQHITKQVAPKGKPINTSSIHYDVYINYIKPF